MYKKLNHFFFDRCSVKYRPGVIFGPGECVKSVHKILGGGRGGSKNRILGNYRWLCTKLIERSGGGGSKNCLLDD